MIIKNCKIIYKDKIEEGSILIKDGKIEIVRSNIHTYKLNMPFKGGEN